MKHLFLIVILCFMGNVAQGQNNAKRISPEILNEIKSEVEAQIPSLKIKLLKQDLNDDEIAFKIDTFRIETIASKRMKMDDSTAGMNMAVDELTTSYDKLLNKYYGKLFKSLNEEDQKTLITAQKAWLAFRDAERKLIEMLTDDQYSGGGTIQSNIRMSQFSSIVIERTNKIFRYYNEIVKYE
jgi:uncharacterized protein YecT (DUF1311 family)